MPLGYPCSHLILICLTRRVICRTDRSPFNIHPPSPSQPQEIRQHQHSESETNERNIQHACNFHPIPSLPDQSTDYRSLCWIRSTPRSNGRPERLSKPPFVVAGGVPMARRRNARARRENKNTHKKKVALVKSKKPWQTMNTRRQVQPGKLLRLRYVLCTGRGARTRARGGGRRLIRRRRGRR